MKDRMISYTLKILFYSMGSVTGAVLIEFKLFCEAAINIATII